MAEPVINVLGPVALKHRGEYAAGSIYEKLDVVTYQGSSYCAKTSTSGNAPTDTDYWDLIASKGNTGATGPAPVKGVDYYTAEDKAELEATLSSDVTSEVTEQLSDLTSATPLVATSTAEMTDTTRIYVNTADGHWYWYDGNSWEDGGIYQATAITTDKSLSSINVAADAKITGDIVNKIKIYKNLGNITTLENGKYYSGGSGTLTTKTGENVGIIDPIMLKPNTKYFIRNYNSTYVYLSREDDTIINRLRDVSDFTETTRYNYKVVSFTTPNEYCYLNMTLATNLDYSKLMVVEDFLPLTVKQYNVPFLTTINGVPTVNNGVYYEDVIVGTDYPGFESALSTILAAESMLNEKYQVNMVIPDGTVTIRDEIVLPSYFHIIGKSGDKTKCIIQYIPNNPTSSDVENKSAFKITGNNNFKNVTITAINARYVIHDESANSVQNWTQILDNCTFEHFINDTGSWSSQNAWGEGASSGSTLIATNCDFITHANDSFGFSVHNNIDFVKPMKHYFNNCNFVSDNYGAVRCEGLASGTDDEVIINNSNFKGNLYCTNSLTIKLSVSGCNLVGSNTNHYFEPNSIAYYKEYTKKLLNDTGETILAGTIVCYVTNKKIKPMTSADSNVLLAGFTIGDTLNGEMATVITKGFYRDTSATNLGDSYSVYDGVPVPSKTNIIGYASGGGFIKINADLI